MLRRPRTQINKENVDVLQLLDLLKDFEQYVDEDMVCLLYTSDAAAD